MKAVAEAAKMDKVESGKPAWLMKSGLGDVVGWVPRKFGELKTFFSEVKTELKKVTWPSRNEVYATTIVVIVTTIFFGFYLYGLDLLMTQIFSHVLRQSP